MNLTDRFSISDEVVAREVGGETMLLDLSSGTYFGLDQIGGRIWQLLEDGSSPAEACDALIGEYDVIRETLETDVLALLADLLERRLIVAGA